MQAFALSAHLQNIEYLDAGQCEIGDIGVQVLALSRMRRLKFLNLRHNGIGENGYKMLAMSESMPLLNEIRIYEGNTATTEAKNVLRRAKALPALRHIS